MRCPALMGQAPEAKGLSLAAPRATARSVSRSRALISLPSALPAWLAARCNCAATVRNRRPRPCGHPGPPEQDAGVWTRFENGTRTPQWLTQAMCLTCIERKPDQDENRRHSKW